MAELALHTLQRREDIIQMQFEDIQNGHLHVRQHKTDVCLRLHIDPPLDAVIKRCRDSIASPFLVHRRPQRIRREYAKNKGHWTAITPDMVSRAFQAARDRSSVYEHLAPAERPTYHEIRSLGADLYRKAGVDPQLLLGHSSQRMTQKYLNGHEHWEDVVAGLINV
jgi:integrase